MKIQDHLPLTEGIVKINARKFFVIHLQKHFSSLREQSNYKGSFPRLSLNCTIPPCYPPSPYTLCEPKSISAIK